MHDSLPFVVGPLDRTEFASPDLTLARLLLRGGKPVFLAVSKIDTVALPRPRRPALRLRSRMTLQIHDELLFVVLPAEAGELQTLVNHEMEHVAEFSVPILAKVALGPNWRDIK
jgi:hypothetical protein